MKTYNIAPYFDDFVESDNYHQIMFKPGVAVQARELTQLQTILRDQIEKFGNHIFKHGSVVIPGNSYADLGVPYAKLQPTYGGSSISAASFEGEIIVGADSGIRAYVKKAVAAEGSDPITLYLAYLNGDASGGVEFSNSENIYVEGSGGTNALLQASNATGTGSIAVINSGVYYINGNFVYIAGQSTIISKYSSTPSCHVLLKIIEELVDSYDDSNLLDPAQGSYNYSAPGADRVKISLTLTTLPLGTSITDDYVEIMRYDSGVLEEHAKNSKYSELEKSLARRTFDESGNYVVNGLVPSIREHLRTADNDGVYVDGDIDKFVVQVSSGKAYINGFEVDKISSTKITVDKARTSSHIRDTDITLRPEFGQYLIVSNVVGTMAIRDRETVDLYNDNDAANASATKIGTARVIGIDYLIGDPSTGAIYKLWVTDISMIGSYKLESAGGIRYQSTKYAYVLTKYSAPVSTGAFTAGEVVTHASSGRTATVKYWDATTSTLYAYKHDHTKETPKVGDLIVGDTSTTNSVLTVRTVLVSIGQNSAVFQLPKFVPYSLKNPNTNAYDLQYTVQKELTIVCDSGGSGSVSVSSGETIDPIEVGTFVAVGPSGIVSNSNFSLNVDGTTLTFVGGSGYASVTIKAYAAVSKDSVSPKTKSLTTNTQTFTTSTSNIVLEKTDVVSITSIIDSTGDITANYNFWNGQTDFSYERSTLTLKQGKPAPTGNVTVVYSFYQHSIAGDFFCIDSYPAGVLDKNVTYVSPTSGNLVDLVSCLDFRPSVGANGLFTGSNSRRNDLIISGVNFISSLQFYVPRIDVLTVNSAGALSVISGIPAEQPSIPTVPDGQYVLNQIYVPPYTPIITSITLKRMDVERFTMNDIKKIVNRVGRVEDFATLTAAELSVTGVNIIDAATGLDRYKTGYLVENFTSPLSIARTTSGDYAACFVGASLHPSMEELSCDLTLLNTSSGYTTSNGYLMLPYTEVVFAKQGLSSRVTNINPFIVISWNGILGVEPSVDNWVVINELPTIYESTTETVTVNNYIPCPPAPPPPRPTPRPPSPPYTPPPPPLPSPMYGGWYGQVLGRAGETEAVQVNGQTYAGGVGWWSNVSNSGYTAEQVATNFLTAASHNYLTGAESMFRTNSTVALLASNPVLTSTTTFSYGAGGQIVATTTGTNLDGTTFTRSGY